MQVRDIMSKDPGCCTPDTSVQHVANLMIEYNCGEIPVVDEDHRPVGVVTDRDIACRAVAQGKDPQSTKARDVMSSPVLTVTPESSVEDCCRKLEENQVRRAPVVDETGGCCGMLSQADVAGSAPEHESAKLVQEVSRPTVDPSAVGGRGCC